MKLGKLIIDIDGIELSNQDIEILQHPYIGGVILFARNFSSAEQIISLVKNIKSLSQKEENILPYHSPLLPEPISGKLQSREI